MKNHLYFWTLAGLVAIASYLLISFDTKNEQSQDLSQKPQFYMQDFTQYTADSTGKLSTIIAGSSLNLFTKKDYAIIKNPKVTINRNTDNEWRLKSANAQSFARKLLLSGDVEARSADGVQEFLTPSLWLYHDTASGETDQPVTLKGTISLTKGMGARFYANTNTIKILKNATTTYKNN